MGKAWDTFVKVNTDEDGHASVDVEFSIPGWFWILLVCVIFLLIILVSVMTAYKQGLRGWALLTHCLTTCLTAAMELSRRRGGGNDGHARPRVPLDHSRSAEGSESQV